MHHDQLNSDEVMALLASLENAEGNDRRRHPRSPAPQHVTAVLRRAGSAPVHAVVRDLSRSGVGLYSPVPLDADDHLDLLINPRGKSIHASCRVATCRLDPNGRYAVGLEFLEISRTSPTAAVPAAPTQSTDPEPESDPTTHIESVAARLNAALAS